MTTTIVYQYRVWCNTESKYVYTWGTTTPVTCPNNSADSINTNTITIIQTMSDDLRTIKNDVPGTYRAQTIPFDIPAGSTGDINIHNFSFPHDTYIWTSEFVSEASMVGDTINVIVAPDTTVGVLTTNATTGATTLSVSASVLSVEYITKGTNITITDGVTPQELGMITAIDTSNNTITVENSLANDYNIGAYILMNLYMVKDQYIGVANKTYNYGKKGFSARAIPANTNLRIAYTNTTGTAKRLNFDMEFNYLQKIDFYS